MTSFKRPREWGRFSRVPAVMAKTVIERYSNRLFEPQPCGTVTGGALVGSPRVRRRVGVAWRRSRATAAGPFSQQGRRFFTACRHTEWCVSVQEGTGHVSMRCLETRVPSLTTVNPRGCPSRPAIFA